MKQNQKLIETNQNSCQKQNKTKLSNITKWKKPQTSLSKPDTLGHYSPLL